MKLKPLFGPAVFLAIMIGVANIKPVMAAVAPAAKAAAESAFPKKLSLLDLNKELSTFDDYTTILQKAGYTTKINTETSGKQVLAVDWQDKTGRFGLTLTQDKNDRGDNLTFVAPLSSFTKYPKVPAEVFFKLVEAQDATHGWYFVFNPQIQGLFLCRTIPSVKVTSRQLITELENFQFATQLTARVWNPAAWITKSQSTPNTPAPPQAPAPAPTK